jgi:hypothetical protein
MITAVKIRFDGTKGFGGVEAITDGETWECKSPHALTCLESECSAKDVEREPVYAPNREFMAVEMALLAVKYFGAEIVHYYDDGYTPEYPPGVRF